MVNDCIRIGLENNVSSLKKLSSLAYNQLSRYAVLNYYKLGAISRAAGILAARKKSVKRGIRTKCPYTVKLQLVSCYAFKIESGMLRFPVRSRQYFNIPLNKYSQQILRSDPRLAIRSFTLTDNSVSIAFSKDISERKCTTTGGIDRNLRNITFGNLGKLIQYDLTRATEIAETTGEIMKSIKRNDVRIRKKLALKYGKRRRNRINQMLHRVSKHIVKHAIEHEQAIVFEDIRHIRRLYQKGNGQNRRYRGMMNSWSFYEIKRQIEYKAKWSGIPIVQLSSKDTRGTSSACPQCGERLQEDRRIRRQLWCSKCRRWQDRDIVAAMNLSLKGWVMFAHSKGDAGEAMKGNAASVEPLILRVDASKLSHGGSTIAGTKA